MMDGWSYSPDGESEEDMARRPAAKVSIDEARVAKYAARLEAAGSDRASFEREVAALKSDTDVAISDVIEIAVRFRRGGKRPGSRKAALELIEKRFLELIRSAAQIRQAAKARPW